MAITKIQAGALPADVITTAAIDDASITHAKLHTTMDLSSKTVTLPSLSQTIVNSSHIQMGGNLDVVGQIGAYNNPGSSWGKMILRAADFEFKNAGSTIKMVLDTSGNVGIGTSSPEGTLQVENSSNNALILNAPANRYNSVGFQTAGTDKWWLGRADSDQIASDAFFIGTDAGNAIDPGGLNAKLVIAQSGNVGIGTTSPTARLDVRRGDADGKIAEFHQNTGYGIDIGSSQSVAYISSGYNQRLDFKTDPTSGQTERMSILANGNVGIGTSSPTHRLDVLNDGGEQLRILAWDQSTSARANIDFWYLDAGGSPYQNSQISTLAAGNAGNGNLVFSTRPTSGALTERLRITSTGNVGIGTTSPDAKLSINADALDQPALVLGNVDGGGIAYVHRQSRYLLSNGSNWIGDGKDPIAVIGTNSSSTNKFPSAGLVMHNESQTDNTFSTPIIFGNKSNSGTYNTAYAYIAGRKNGQGVDSNWSTGELWIDTAGTKHNGNDAYMDHSPAIKIRNTGTVDMRWQPFSYGTLGGNNLTNNTGWQLSPLVTQGLVYNNNATHGYGLTVAEPGYYMCYGTSLYAPGNQGYVYIGWALNGSVQHHWHSNHTISSNHDWVSSMIRWCNAGDHLTIEGVNSPISATWGGGHSQYYVWKMG
jgi:hypothetical protein